jgi:hypothetical protein
MAEPKFIVNGKEYAFPTDLTLGEMCDAETYFNVEFGNNETSGMRMAAALLWIAIRRGDDSVTVDDIRALPPEVFRRFEKEQTDARPPDSEAGKHGSAETSGSDSRNGGGDPADARVATGQPS